jgi:pimeloyl-ACP methyl ester carboxylesterase
MVKPETPRGRASSPHESLGDMAMIPAILLVHGWPDDASAWDGIAPVLNDAGFRTIAPMHRGSGRTRFLSAKARRTGNVERSSKTSAASSWKGLVIFVPSRGACSCCSRADSALFSVVSFTDATIWEMERCRLLALHVILLLRGNSIAFGSKRTLSLIL